MKEKVLCEKCGSEMKSYTQGHTCGMMCTKCDFGWATTYFKDIEIDENLYTISILQDNIVTDKRIKTIAKLFAVNFITAKKFLIEGQENIFQGKAIIVKEKKQILDNEGVLYTINPNFLY